MPQIRPFRAIRYAFDRFGGDLSGVVAPPYDVLDQGDKDALLAKDRHNVVAIDLPHIPPKEEGPAQVYLEARATMDRWLESGVLTVEPGPAIYVYDQTFEYRGRPHTRHMFITSLRLHDFKEGIVLPHEQTFGGPKADRLALTKATGCNVSPVFGLYTDPENAAGRAFTRIVDRKPDAVARLDDVENKMWVVSDREVIDNVRDVMATKKVFIADGHHRYTTALNYRDYLAGQQGGKLPQDHPANFVLIVLASMDDPGCVIQEYCRVLAGEGVTLRAIEAAWREGTSPADEKEADLTLHDGASKTRTYLKFTRRDVLDGLAADRDPSWRKLDIAYIHRYLIEKLAAEHMGHAPEIRYVKSSSAACQLADEISGVALIPRPTPMEQLREVSEAGELMPQKSTFFYPKLATGLTIHPLREVE